jgi:hypothetical protein
MRNRAFTAMLVSAFVFVLPAALYAEVLSSLQGALAHAFPGQIVTTSEWVSLSSNQTSRIRATTGIRVIPNVLKYHTIRRAEGDSDIPPGRGTAIGYATVCTTAGKHGPIRVFVATSPERKVLRTEILYFNERRGRPVRKQAFLSQFEGKTTTDPVRLRKDIDGITGATISSRAVTQAVRKALCMLSIVTEGNEKASEAL